MSFHIHVLMHNEHFSQEHADAHFNGEESENNKKWDWEDEMKINGDLVKVDVARKSTYTLQGTKGENETFSIDIVNMMVITFEFDGGTKTQIACSESLYELHQLDEENQTLRLELLGQPYANPVPGVYIASLEFPTELIVGA
ncbi:MAG: hypothetical protein ACI9XP_001290 [Lentimonas sp.]|jgi:hypothetical protein